MYIPLKQAHNIIAMALLIILLVVVIFIVVNYILKRPFTTSLRIAALVGLISTHTQILLGIVLYFLSPLGVSNLSGESIAHPISRFYSLEHPLVMLIAVILLTIGYKATKNENISSKGKFNRLLVFYGIGFTLIIYMIPWFLWN